MKFPAVIRLKELGDEPAGGKARGLKLMIDLGLPVPDGFVILHPGTGKADNSILDVILAELGDSPKAVRSSAVSEDGIDASFAGQFETVLNVTGTDGLQKAIRNCVEKAGTERVKLYSRYRNNEADLRVSVIVQNMVRSKVAGVLFSADPVTPRRDRIVINAVEGYGEELVSGKKDAHQYKIFRSGSNIREAAGLNGGLLSPVQVKELLDGAIRAEEALGHPVDMEWAADDSGKISWLQARPLTTISDVHFNELDTVKGPADDIWTLGNIGEMMPGVTTPLTYSVVVDAIDYGMCVLAGKGGAFRLSERKGYHFIQMFYNRLFLNLTHMMDYASYIWLNKSENIQMALSVKVDPAIRERWKAPFPLRLYNFIRQSVTVLRAPVYLKKLRRLAGNFGIDNRLPAGTLHRELGKRRKDVCAGFGHHLITSAQSGTLYSAFMGILTNDMRLPGAHDHHLATLLLSHIPGIESADAVKSLEYFSGLIVREEDFAEKFTTATPEAGLRLIREEAPPLISQLFQEFILRHGHRCVRESELRENPWETDEIHLVRLLQVKVRFGKVESRSVKLMEDAWRVMKELPFHKRIVFSILLPTARKAVARREISKALAIKMVNELRKGYRALAGKLVGPGLLDDADQIFFLTHDEIGRIIEKKDSSLLEKANRRRTLLTETDGLQFPEVCFGIPEPITEKVVSVIKPGQLQGIPVSSGMVTAPVRIVDTLEDASLLQKGEIMVASFTDIGWTPYFSIVSGLVTEIGSPLSHGAVVAREYGIPAVVGVKGAKSVLLTGEMITLDGDRGFIERPDSASVR